MIEIKTSINVIEIKTTINLNFINKTCLIIKIEILTFILKILICMAFVNNSRYNINDMFKVDDELTENPRYYYIYKTTLLDGYDLDDAINFKYAQNDSEQIYNDPFYYHLKRVDDKNSLQEMCCLVNTLEKFEKIDI